VRPYAAHMTGEVYPKKSKKSPGGRIKVDVGTHRELIKVGGGATQRREA
jgi:hypothetical protein